jgi:hypothetical protein
MYTIDLQGEGIILQNNGQDLLNLNVNDRVSIDGKEFVITNYSFGISWDGEVIQVPTQSYSSYYHNFKNRMTLLYYLTKLFKHCNVPYKVRTYVNRLNLTNEKGKIYACYL